MDAHWAILYASVATYGLAILVSEYDGLGEVLLKLRRRIPLLRCAVCSAVWLAIPINLLSGTGMLGYLASIGGMIVLDRVLR